MRALEPHRFAADGWFPNSPLPLLVYRGALPADADAIEQCFERHGWSGCWRNGIFPFHHFHSNAHEVLGIAAGEARVQFGGPSGEVVSVRAGDVVVIPAGVGHCNRGQSPGLLVIGAYPGGADYDTRLGEPGEYEEACRSVAAVPVPASDPVEGHRGALLRLWRDASGECLRSAS